MVLILFLPVKNRFISHWLPVIGWCAIIFAQSAFATPDVGPQWPYFDKAAHAGIYAFLSLLLSRAFSTLSGWRFRPLKLMVTATILTALYGLGDEWHQSFVPERHAEAADLLADLIGGLIGSGLYLFVRKLRSPEDSAGGSRKSFGVE